MSDRLQHMLRWPLWSWRNLTITTVGLLAVLAVIGRASTTFGSPEATPTPTSAASSTPAPVVDPIPQAPTPAATSSGGSSSHTATGPVDGEGCEVTAERFARAWAEPEAGRRWLPGVAPFATPALVEQLKSVDPAHVPATRVIGRPIVTGSGPKSLTVHVATDGGQVQLVLTRAKGACLVNDIEPVNDVPGAPTPALTPAPVKSGE